jgi:Family of unknown function (DUF5519)
MSFPSRSAIDPPVLQRLPISLPSPRSGARPRTQSVVPHVQTDQWPPPGWIERLAEASLRLPHVGSRQSRMAAPDTKALFLLDGFANGPAEAFIDGHEFCHLHAAPEGSVHLTLPTPIRQQIVALGWAEEHPLARAGFLPQTLVMVYAPRDESELIVVSGIVQASYDVARGSW